MLKVFVKLFKEKKVTMMVLYVDGGILAYIGKQP